MRLGAAAALYRPFMRTQEAARRVDFDDAVIKAVMEGNADLLAHLIAREERLSVSHAKGGSQRRRSAPLLMIAAGLANSRAVLEVLLDHGADVSERVGDGRGVLHFAVGSQNVEFLVQRGASLQTVLADIWHFRFADRPTLLRHRVKTFFAGSVGPYASSSSPDFGRTTSSCFWHPCSSARRASASMRVIRSSSGRSHSARYGHDGNEGRRIAWPCVTAT